MKHIYPCAHCGAFDDSYHYPSCPVFTKSQKMQKELDEVMRENGQVNSHGIWTRREPSSAHEIWDFTPVGHIQVFKNGTAAYWFTNGTVAKAAKDFPTAMRIVEAAQCGHVLAVHHSGGHTISCTITTDGGEYEHDILHGANEAEYRSAKKAWEGSSVRMIEDGRWVRI